MKLLMWIGTWIIPLVDWLTKDEVTGKSWVKKDVPAPLCSAGPSAEEAERPFPGPIIQQPALADREQGRKDYDKDFEEKRRIWAERQEWENAVYEDIDELTEPFFPEEV